MSTHSRRNFFLGTGAGAAGVITALNAPAAAHAAPGAAAAAKATGGSPLVAYVRDVARGEISLLVGDREVVFTDRSLATKLARRAR